MTMTISALTATFDCIKRNSLGLSPGDSAVAIKFPVGPAPAPRCRNLPDDVRTVQKALNRFTPLDGGPVEPLKVDGIFGPKTKAAIYHFQQKWGIKPPGGKVPDNIVDPEGKTIKRLRAGGGTIPNLALEFAERIPRVLQIISAARAAILSAKTSYTLPSNSLFGKAALDRADRHFRVTQTKNPLRRLEEIDSIFLNMQTAIGYIPQGIILAADEPAHIASGVIMFAYDNGYHRREATEVSSDGLHYGSIYLCPRSRTLNQESFAYAMIHEMGHYVPPIGLEITDNAYFHKDPLKYERLDAEKRYRNADCYSQFAFDAIGKAGYKVY